MDTSFVIRTLYLQNNKNIFTFIKIPKMKAKTIKHNKRIKVTIKVSLDGQRSQNSFGQC